MTKLVVNLSLDTQKLLEDNRNRASANRLAQEERKNINANAAQLAQPNALTPGAATVLTPVADPKGRAAELGIPRRPTAQRRKQDMLSLFGLSGVNSFALPGSYQHSSQQWTAYGSLLRIIASDNIFFDETSWQETNSYTRETTTWQPSFSQDSRTNRRYWQGTQYALPNIFTNFDWTFEQRSRAYPDYPSIEATPPVLPFPVTDLRFIAPNFRNSNGTPASYPWGGNSLTTSDGRYIYHTKLINVSTLNDASFGLSLGFFGSNPNFYEYYHSRRWIETPNFLWEETGQYVAPYNNFDLYGLYWRFDSKTGETTFSSQFLKNSNVLPNTSAYATDLNTASQFWLSYMDANDPVSRLWNSHLDNNPNTDPSSLIGSFLSNSLSYLNRWPKTLVYDQRTGVLTIVTALNSMSTPQVFTKTIGTLTYSYGDIPVFELPTDFNPTQTTMQQMIASGWTTTTVAAQNDFASLDAYFAIQP